MKKYLFSVILVVLLQSSVIQFLSFAVLSFFYLVAMLCIKPYVNKTKFLIMVMSETLFLVTMICIVIFSTFHSSLDVKQVKDIGWAVNILFLT